MRLEDTAPTKVCSYVLLYRKSLTDAGIGRAVYKILSTNIGTALANALAGKSTGMGCQGQAVRISAGQPVRRLLESGEEVEEILEEHVERRVLAFTASNADPKTHTTSTMIWNYT